MSSRFRRTTCGLICCKTISHEVIDIRIVRGVKSERTQVVWVLCDGLRDSLSKQKQICRCWAACTWCTIQKVQYMCTVYWLYIISVRLHFCATWVGSMWPIHLGRLVLGIRLLANNMVEYSLQDMCKHQTDCPSCCNGSKIQVQHEIYLTVGAISGPMLHQQLSG